jgi:hypothetical protein
MALHPSHNHGQGVRERGGGGVSREVMHLGELWVGSRRRPGPFTSHTTMAKVGLMHEAEGGGQLSGRVLKSGLALQVSVGGVGCILARLQVRWMGLMLSNASATS